MALARARAAAGRPRGGRRELERWRRSAPTSGRMREYVYPISSWRPTTTGSARRGSPQPANRELTMGAPAVGALVWAAERQRRDPLRRRSCGGEGRARSSWCGSDELRLSGGPRRPRADDAVVLEKSSSGRADRQHADHSRSARTAEAARDRLLGPNADVAIVSERLRARRVRGEPRCRSGSTRACSAAVGGFIAVGGSLESRWKTLALPVCNADLLDADRDRRPGRVEGAGTPRSMCSTTRLARAAAARAQRGGNRSAARSGRRVSGRRGCARGVTSSGRPARGTQVQCATCGAHGELTVDAGGRVRIGEEGRRASVISLDEKRAHFARSSDGRARQRRDEIEARASAYDGFDPVTRPYVM